MIGKIHGTISWRMSKLRKMMRQPLYPRSVMPMEPQPLFGTLLMSLYDNDMTSWKQWNQAIPTMWKRGKAKRSHNEVPCGENFNGDLTQFKDIDKEMSYTPLTGADNLEKTFVYQRWFRKLTISVEDYKELAGSGSIMTMNQEGTFTPNVSSEFVTVTINLKIVRPSSKSSGKDK